MFNVWTLEGCMLRRDTRDLTTSFSCLKEEDSGPMESLDEAWRLLSGSFVLTLQPASSSTAPALMDICDHCLRTRCYEPSRSGYSM